MRGNARAVAKDIFARMVAREASIVGKERWDQISGKILKEFAKAACDAAEAFTIEVQARERQDLNALWREEKESE